MPVLMALNWPACGQALLTLFSGAGEVSGSGAG
jgi:hypothetical protein